ncbi:MAG TPA: ATP-binding protein [Thermoanaerobaculia bacterium]|nr:ATP-binding protein [Thermoanaerobaculia bacterium]
MAKSPFSRRLLIASLVFGLFVLFDIALFGWLIFRSLSQREVERTLLETREEARKLADQIARRAERQGKDLYTAVAVERETQTYIDQMLHQREIVRQVEIRDKNGMLVYEGRANARVLSEPEERGSPPSIAPPVVSPELQPHVEPPRVETRSKTTESAWEVPDIQVPIGDYGLLQIGISGGELSKRIEVLRRDLIRQTAFVAVLTVVLLLSAYAAVWLLLRRAQRLEVQAAEAERLAYIGTLASGLAHEIRNPLNSLNLNMQMLEEEIDEHGSAPTGKRLLSITRSELSRLERLVTDFLAYAKPRPLELEEMPAVRPLERVRELLAGEIQKRGALVEVEDRSGGARVRVDPSQMSQLLLNLAQNSFAAAEQAGRRPVLKLSAYRQGPAVCLELEDNGVGMSAAEQAKIFDLFYSTRKGGTGLGLAIVERIARAHGGRIGVRSTQGVGTAVLVELPAASSSEPAAEKERAPAEGRPSQAVSRILP